MKVVIPTIWHSNQRWTSHGYYTSVTSHMTRQRMNRQVESRESWWIVWIVKSSHASLDESHESSGRVTRVFMNRMNREGRVTRVLMNRMNRQVESRESWWIAWTVEAQNNKDCQQTVHKSCQWQFLSFTEASMKRLSWSIRQLRKNSLFAVVVASRKKKVHTANLDTQISFAKNALEMGWWKVHEVKSFFFFG